MFDGERETKTGDELVKYVFGFLPPSATDGHRATQFFCGGFFGWYYDELLSDCHFSRTDPCGDHFVEGTKLNAVRAERMRAQRRTA